MTRLLLILSTGLLAAGWRLHTDALNAAWQDGAEHVCEAFARGRPFRVVGGVCQIELAGTWHKAPPVVSWSVK